MRIFDITPTLSERIGVFPGDVPFQREIGLDFKRGDHLLLSAIRSTLHVGAHADAPNHYAVGGEGIAARDLTFYLGRCLVLEASAPRGTRIGREHLKDKWRVDSVDSKVSWPAPRLLVRTGSFPEPERWNSDFNSLDPRFIEEAAAGGVKLIGIDTPSIDPEDSKGLEAHQAIARNDLAILEGLVLDGVAEGLYTLIALPLKLEGADAAPVRAVLVDDPDLFGF